MTVQKYEGFNNSVFMKHQRYKANIPGITEMVENKFKAGYQLCDRCNDNQVLKLREEREFDPSDIESDDEETLGRFFTKFLLIFLFTNQATDHFPDPSTHLY